MDEQIKLNNPGLDLTEETASRELEPAKRGPDPPPEVDMEQAAELRRNTATIVQQLVEAEGGQAMRTIDEVSVLGVREQSTATREIDLLKVRLGAIMADEGGGAQIARDLAELRSSLDDLNPSNAPGGSVLSRAIKAIPIVGRIPSPAKAVRKIAIRYEPVSRQVATIETRLREGRATLLHDNVELRKLYEAVEQQRPEITRSAYLGELIMDGLDEAVQGEKDVDRTRRLEMALANVATRVQDLHTMNEICMQYLVSIEMSRQNNTSLVHAIDRTLALGSNVVMIGLAIQVALSRQSRVMEANQRTREFLGNLVVSNAELIKRHTEEIGDIYKSPVIAIEKVTQAHSALVDAIASARRIRAEGVSMARQNIQRLNTLASQVNGEVLALATRTTPG